MGVFAVALAIAACGSAEGDAAATGDEINEVAAVDSTIEGGATDSEPESPEEAAPAATTSTSPEVVAAESDQGADDTQPSPAEEPDPGTGLEPQTLLTFEAGQNDIDVLGGVGFELSEETPGIVGGNCVGFVVPDYTGSSPFPPTAIVGRVVLSGLTDTSPISTVDEWILLYGDQPAPVATGESISLFGEELAGYRVEGPFTDGPPPNPSFLNCATDSESTSEFAFLPSPFADVFIAETDDGLLIAYGGGFTADEAADARALFDTIIPTLTAE